MRKTFKYRLNPTREVEQKLVWTLSRCRELYNAALTERRDAYNFHVKQHPNYYDEPTRKQRTSELHIGYYEQQNALPQIKAEIRAEYQDIAAHVLQDVLRRLDRAFQAFFRRIRNGENPGYPRFQGRNRYDSFTYPDQAGWKFDGWYLHLSKIGSIKVRLHRPLEGEIKTITIKHEVDEWYVTFSCEVEEPPKLPVTHLATLSNGEMIEHPRYLRKAQKTLEKRQQALSRKKRGSHRRDKARKLVAKAHRKIARQRRDFQHKAVKQLVDRYQVLVFEDIQISNLARKPKPKQDENGNYLHNGASAKGGLNKSISDAGWASFVSICTVKAAWAGRTIIKVDPKFTSQVCSQCGQVKKKDLSERWHSCDCGAELDRDINAAINILERGRRQRGATRVEAPCL